MFAWLLAVWLLPANLASDDWQTRDVAEDMLRAAGVFAVPALTPLASSENPEVRQRARSLLAKPSALLRDLATAHAWLDRDPSDDDIKALMLDPAKPAAMAESFRRLGLLSYVERDVMATNYFDWAAWGQNRTGDIEECPRVTDTESAIYEARNRWQLRNGGAK